MTVTEAIDREGAGAQARVACGTATRVQSKAGAWAALFDDDAESDAYLGWQATTRARQGLASAIRARQVSTREEPTCSMKEA